MRDLQSPSQQTLRVARWLLLSLGVGFWLCHLPGFIQDDIRLYYSAIESLHEGVLPYRDRIFPYPPYALAWLFLPGVFGNLDGFWIAFMLEVFFCDLVLKGVLLTAGARLANGWLSLLPCAFYSVAAALQHFLYFQRLDVFAVATTTIALVLVPCARWFAAGLLIGIAGGTKLYALLFAPALALMAWREKQAQRFFGGLYASFFPLAVLGVWMPWWEFAFSHAGRGLQVESLYASLLWLLNKLGVLEMHWVRVTQFFEVQGPGAAALAVASKAIWTVLVVGSVWLSCRAARAATESNLGALVRTTWLPVLVFVTFGPVLSTQFMLWLAPLAALVALNNGRAPAALYMLAAVLTPIIFPSPEYVTGLTLTQTIALVTRNLLLVALCVYEWRVHTPLGYSKPPLPAPGEIR